jgi:hypothetical protein
MNLQVNQQYLPSAGNNDDVNHIRHIDIKSIQSEVDPQIKELSEEWKASIPFSCYIINENDNPCTSSYGSTFSKIDICDYLGGQMNPAVRLVCCPNTYKPPSSNNEMTRNNSDSCNGWKDSQRDLSIAAHDAGNPIISNGSQQSNKRDMNNCSFDEEYSIEALEHLLWNCLILLNINVCLWQMIGRTIG